MTLHKVREDEARCWRRSRLLGCQCQRLRKEGVSKQGRLAMVLLMQLEG